LRREVFIGVDASVRRNSAAIVAVCCDGDAQKVRLIAHRIFQPSPSEPLDFEGTIEATIRDMVGRFRPVEVRYDPWQMQASAQRLLQESVPMVEFPQTQALLTDAGSNLYELVKGRNLVVYPDAEIRLAVQRSIAVETGRGWRIVKEKAGHKIDVVVALALAALAAVEGIANESYCLLMARAERRRRPRLPPRPAAPMLPPSISAKCWPAGPPPAAPRRPRQASDSRMKPPSSAPAARLRSVPSCCAPPAAGAFYFEEAG
jgi:hypothetical protein